MGEEEEDHTRWAVKGTGKKKKAQKSMTTATPSSRICKIGIFVTWALILFHLFCKTCRMVLVCGVWDACLSQWSFFLFVCFFWCTVKSNWSDKNREKKQFHSFYESDTSCVERSQCVVSPPGMIYRLILQLLWKMPYAEIYICLCLRCLLFFISHFFSDV